jgi:fructose-bisphosphate aldolase, class II
MHSPTQEKTALKPGVVTGADYVRLVKACKSGGYALPAVNVSGTNTVNAALEAAARAKSDIIIQLSGGGAQFFAGRGIADAATARLLGAVSAAQHVHTVAAAYGICVALHTDHADRKLLPWIDALLAKSEESFAHTGRPLFSSHMIDLSEEPIEDNLAACEKFLARMAPIGMSLEMELGVTGGEEDGVGKDLDELDNARLYTQPEDVLAAWRRLSRLGHFSIAAAFGNVHGVYAPGNVKLQPDILDASQRLAQSEEGLGPNPFDFVFHGGSGSDVADIRRAVSFGVFKMNIDTDIQFAMAKGVGAYVMQSPNAFRYQLDPDTGKPLKKQYDPREWLRAGEKQIASRLTQACEELGSAGRSVAVI